MIGKVKPFSLFEFKTTIAVLEGYVAYRRAETPQFSLNSWTKRLGFSTSGILVNVLKGRRKIPMKIVPKFSDTMGLTGIERDYFSALVARDHVVSKGGVELERCESKIRAILHKLTTHTVSGDEVDRFAKLGTLAVKEMIGILGQDATPERVRAGLRLKLSKDEVEQIVEDLVSLGFVTRTNEGVLQLIEMDGVETTDNVSSQAIRQFHRASLINAAETLDSVPIDRRYFASYALPVRKDSMKEAQNAIDTFVHDFVARFVAENATGDSVYQMNVNFVPLSVDKNLESLE